MSVIRVRAWLPPKMLRSCNRSLTLGSGGSHYRLMTMLRSPRAARLGPLPLCPLPPRPLVPHCLLLLLPPQLHPLLRRCQIPRPLPKLLPSPLLLLAGCPPSCCACPPQPTSPPKTIPYPLAPSVPLSTSSATMRNGARRSGGHSLRCGTPLWGRCNGSVQNRPCNFNSATPS